MFLYLLTSALTFGLLIVAEYHTITSVSQTAKWLGFLLISLVFPFPLSLVIVAFDAVNDVCDR